MDRKADHRVHHRLAGREHRHIVRQRLDHVGKPIHPLGCKQQRLRLDEARARQHPHDHLAFSHEQSLASDEVALADVAIAGDAPVVRVVDRDDARYQIFTRWSGARYRPCPGLTSKAGYHGSWLRTVCALYSPGEWTPESTLRRREASRNLAR